MKRFAIFCHISTPCCWRHRTSLWVFKDPGWMPLTADGLCWLYTTCGPQAPVEQLDWWYSTGEEWQSKNALLARTAVRKILNGFLSSRPLPQHVARGCAAGQGGCRQHAAARSSACSSVYVFHGACGILRLPAAYATCFGSEAEAPVLSGGPARPVRAAVRAGRARVRSAADLSFRPAELPRGAVFSEAEAETLLCVGVAAHSGAVRQRARLAACSHSTKRRT